MTPAKLKERKEKGLCCKCNEQFRPGHRCQQLFMIEACNENRKDDGGIKMGIEDAKDEEVLGISLHAITGTRVPTTMQVQGKI